MTNDQAQESTRIAQVIAELKARYVRDAQAHMDEAKNWARAKTSYINEGKDKLALSAHRSERQHAELARVHQVFASELDALRESALREPPTREGQTVPEIARLTAENQTLSEWKESALVSLAKHDVLQRISAAEVSRVGHIRGN